jgi:hypothetical protein
MKNLTTKILALAASLTAAFSAPQVNAQVLLTDNFSSSTSWAISNSVTGTFNNIAISGGTLNFNQVHCSIHGNTPGATPQACDRATRERRARRSLGSTLNSHDAFRLEVDYTFLDPSNTLPLGSIPMALTAGINDVLAIDSVWNTAINTNQDAIGFWLGTSITNNGNCTSIRNGGVTLSPFYKDGAGSPVIQAGFIPVANNTYRLRLERINATLVTFQVFNVTAPHVCIFSSDFCIPDATILTGFNNVQTANLHQGSVSRVVSSRVDNLSVQLVNRISDTYDTVTFTEDFSSGLANWTRVNVNTQNISAYTPGTAWNVYNNIGVVNNELQLKDIRCGGIGTPMGNGQCDGAQGERRIYRQLPAGSIANQNAWRLNFDFGWINAFYDNGTGTPPQSAMGSIPMALTAGTADVVANTPVGGTVTNTNQDAIGVMFTSSIIVNSTDQCASTLGAQQQPSLAIFYKDGTINPTLSTDRINLNQLNGNFQYISLDRLDATTLRLSVFTDAARTQHKLGSPITMTIPAGVISNLTTLQEANLYKDNRGRSIKNRIDNIQILAPTCGTQYDAAFNVTGTCSSPTFTINTTVSAGATNPGGVTHRWDLYLATDPLNGVGNANLNSLLQTVTTATASFPNLLVNYTGTTSPRAYIVRHRVGIAPFFVETRTLVTAVSLFGTCAGKTEELSATTTPSEALFNVFPNPTTTELNLNYTDMEDAEAQLNIFDITGKLVMQQKVQANNNHSIDVSNISTGVYIAQLLGANINKSIKFVKQ